MKLLNSNFSKKGVEIFCKLTRKEQKEWLKKRNPLALPNEIEKALKGVKYGKSTKHKKEVRKSHENEATKQDGRDSDKGQHDTASKEE